LEAKVANRPRAVGGSRYTLGMKTGVGAVLLGLMVCGSAWGQFDLEESHTTASLRGIDSLGAGIAWASGANGTVLRTEDGGYLWQPCTIPKGAEKLDFRGVQAFDANTAVVMASGKGAASRIYKTTDGCQSWKLVFENPDEDGFFDGLRKVTGKQMYLMGDPVKGKFAMFFSPDQGSTWLIADDPGLDADKNDGAFAASNSGLFSMGTTIYFVTGGGAAAHVYATRAHCGTKQDEACAVEWGKTDIPLAAGAGAAGAFSLAGRTVMAMSGKLSGVLVAVGGDYQKPEASAGTAAFSRDGGARWAAADAMPGGYRSAVANDKTRVAWLAVGPTGSDVSFDDGKSWKPLAGETASGWNAVSLPFVVGSKGRIGKIRDDAWKR
jgi:photosystem II stability/assembly factor-like uncharacterized protein